MSRYPLINKDIVNQRIQGKNVELIGEYYSARKKSVFRCNSCSHEWLTTPDSVMRLSSCPVCSAIKVKNKITLDEAIFVSRIETLGLKLLEPYVNMKTKIRFECSCGNKNYLSRPDNVRAKCPLCTRYSIKLSLPTHGYILLFDDFVKYGISNNLARRLKEHTRSGSFTVIKTKLFDTGFDAFKWECYVKQVFGANFIDQNRMKNGFTETLDPSLLNDIQSTL